MFSSLKSGRNDERARFCCQNTGCPKHGMRGARNLTVFGHYGPHRRRLLDCRACQYRFSERKGTPLFHMRRPDDKALDVLAHLAGCGVRQTGRLTGGDKFDGGQFSGPVLLLLPENKRFRDLSETRRRSRLVQKLDRMLASSRSSRVPGP